MKAILQNGQAKLEALGIEPNADQKMANTALNAAFSDDSISLVSKVIDNASSPLNYLNNSIDDGAQAFRAAYDNAKNQNVSFDLQLDNLEKTFYHQAIHSGRTPEESTLASKLMRKDAQIWAETYGVNPEKFLELISSELKSPLNLMLLNDIKTAMQNSNSPADVLSDFFIDHESDSTKAAAQLMIDNFKASGIIEIPKEILKDSPSLKFSVDQNGQNSGLPTQHQRPKK